MSSRSLNKAKRRQESGKGSSGGSRLLNLFRHYIIYSTAQLELKKGTVRAKSRKCCESIYPNWMSRVVCPPSFSESRRQHQEPDGITEIGRFRQKFQVQTFFQDAPAIQCCRLVTQDQDESFQLWTPRPGCRWLRCRVRDCPLGG